MVPIQSSPTAAPGESSAHPDDAVPEDEPDDDESMPL
jgi:hypothetical protein